MFENEADVYLHMERVHEYGEECAIYPCEECGYRGQDKIAINQHVKEYHTSNVTSVVGTEGAAEMILIF